MHPLAPWLWAASSVVGGAASFAMAFVVAAAAGELGLGRSDGDLAVRLDLAVFLALIGLFGALVVLGAARPVFGRWPIIGPRQVATAAAGVALAIAVELTLHEWARLQFGYFDPGVVGWTGGLSHAVALSAVAAFAVQVAPPGAEEPPLLASVGLATVACVVLLSNVPGLQDGIQPESWPLAILVALSAAYAIAVVVVGARRMTAG
jgi:hypothetical protein